MSQSQAIVPFASKLVDFDLIKIKCIILKAELGRWTINLPLIY